MIPKLWSRQGQHGWRKEHGLIVRVSNEKTYALVVQGRKGRCEGGPGGRKGPENGEDKWRDQGKQKPGGIDRHDGEIESGGVLERCGACYDADCDDAVDSRTRRVVLPCC
jgi:hypothetical protein